MRKIGPAAFGILFVGMLMASGVNAFDIGENCMLDGDFEAAELGYMPAEWELKVSG